MVFVKGYDPIRPKQQTYHIHAAPQDHGSGSYINVIGLLYLHG
jgi:hypothetical protein